MCIRDRDQLGSRFARARDDRALELAGDEVVRRRIENETEAVSYTHLRAHETVLDLVCRLLLEKKKKSNDTRYTSCLT